MFTMYIRHNLDHFFSVYVTRGGFAILPFIIPGTAHAHKVTQVVDAVVAGKSLYYVEFFGFKRTNSCSPFSFVRTM